MPRMLYIISEGRTECAFVKRVLAQHLEPFNWTAYPITLITGDKTNGSSKGGFRRSKGYEHAINEICSVISNHDINDVHATFFDLYGFPVDIPCHEKAKSLTSPQDKAKLYECQIKKDVAELFEGNKSFRSDLFLPYVQPYEFECFLFVDPKLSADEFSDGNSDKAKKLEDKMSKIIRDFDTPEHINDSFETAPSKRLEKLVPNFREKKVSNWKIAQAVGIQRIRDACPHFNKWLSMIETFK